MPAAPVPVAQVHGWLLENIACSLELISERASPKENGPLNTSNQNVAMSYAYITLTKSAESSTGLCFIEGISKSIVEKHASDLKGSSVKIITDAGHSANELGIVAELVAASEKIKNIIKNEGS